MWYLVWYLGVTDFAHLGLVGSQNTRVSVLHRLGAGPLEEGVLVGHGDGVRGEGPGEGLHRRAVNRAAGDPTKGSDEVRHRIVTSVLVAYSMWAGLKSCMVKKELLYVLYL